jgi:hypothetical protein
VVDGDPNSIQVGCCLVCSETENAHGPCIKCVCLAAGRGGGMGMKSSGGAERRYSEGAACCREVWGGWQGTGGSGFGNMVDGDPNSIQVLHGAWCVWGQGAWGLGRDGAI